MNDEQFRQLLNHFGLSWDGYRRVRKGVKKRIGRHMQHLGCRTLEQYISVLDRNQDTRRDCELLMTVSVSRFFRDRDLWGALEKEILPSIIKEHTANVKIWSAGCACGEEVYSLKMLWTVIEQKMGRLPELQIWATDMNPAYLNKARAGAYSGSSLKEVPGALQDIYFRLGRKGKKWAIVEQMKRGITWETHNLLSDPCARQFQLVFLRNNLLTYYENESKAPAFQKVIDSLASGGFLVIGTHEKIPADVAGLVRFPGHPCIFQKEVLAHPTNN